MIYRRTEHVRSCHIQTYWTRAYMVYTDVLDTCVHVIYRRTGHVRTCHIQTFWTRAYMSYTDVLDKCLYVIYRRTGHLRIYDIQTSSRQWPRLRIGVEGSIRNIGLTQETG